MIEKLIRTIIFGAVLWIVWYLVKLLIVAAGLPGLVALVVGVILALVFLAWVLRQFDISF